MFVLIPVIRMLANHRHGWVVLTCGITLVAAGLGVAVAGVATHQPPIARIGFLILLIAIIYAVLAARGRRGRRQDGQEQDSRSMRQHD